MKDALEGHDTVLIMAHLTLKKVLEWVKSEEIENYLDLHACFYYFKREAASNRYDASEIAAHESDFRTYRFLV